nr:immunoglobulin light chain junction region [Macaca mulatta]
CGAWDSSLSVDIF